ncbi:uncharacterized protein EV422DRAFT_524186 [Fimicolochytrium jonesii]|uniref:uncharacterized protein n=1 Tax=Fimicolochytrium jonesii TaxID=1396493 RepID=UPI0022FEDCAE|nr:uncharacterized protein EV422DRAFT_524186 [Fimicolochytrium jonesii]KAI8822490.1 hypothetical protein EV422DRAFT_524186 [Fimicolochytrium jonesii]
MRRSLQSTSNSVLPVYCIVKNISRKGDIRAPQQLRGLRLEPFNACSNSTSLAPCPERRPTMLLGLFSQGEIRPHQHQKPLVKSPISLRGPLSGARCGCAWLAVISTLAGRVVCTSSHAMTSMLPFDAQLPTLVLSLRLALLIGLRSGLCGGHSSSVVAVSVKSRWQDVDEDIWKRDIVFCCHSGLRSCFAYVNGQNAFFRTR